MAYKLDWVNEDVAPYRRKTMSRIRGKNTKPEKILRKALWNVGIRYRLNGKGLVGKPDISIKKYKLAIFVDGEFWHGFDWEKNKQRLKTRKEFWIDKIETNRKRDQYVNNVLRESGYEVMRFWSNEIQKNVGACVHQIQQYIHMFNVRWEE